MAVAIVDYGMGNLRSVQRALRSLKTECSITSDHDELRAAERIVLPGVGAFGIAMARLREQGLDTLLTRLVRDEGRPLLGICLGMQLVCNDSEEHGHHEGLGWIDASVRRFAFPPDAVRLRVPHVGWNDVEGRPGSVLVPESGVFYFVHSFHAVARDAAAVSATASYGEQFPACLERDNIFAAQFHPEKSQEEGLGVLRRFLGWQARSATAAAA
jgi:glutamine amidotransferase